MTTRNTFTSRKLIATAAAVLLTPAIAFAAVSEGDHLGKTEAEIKAQLTSMGYEVKEIEVENDEIEAEVVLNGQELEIEIDPATGQVTEIETED